MRQIFILLVLMAITTAYTGEKKKKAKQKHSVPIPTKKQQTDALEFVKTCVRQVRKKDKKVFAILTDAHKLVDFEAEIKKHTGNKLDWEKMFRLSTLTDDEVDHLFEKVLLLTKPMKFPNGKIVDDRVRVSQVVITDKRQSPERKVKALQMVFCADVVKKHQETFQKFQLDFSVYLIDGKMYWEPFGW